MRSIELEQSDIPGIVPMSDRTVKGNDDQVAGLKFLS